MTQGRKPQEKVLTGPDDVETLKALSRAAFDAMFPAGSLPGDCDNDDPPPGWDHRKPATGPLAEMQRTLIKNLPKADRESPERTALFSYRARLNIARQYADAHLQHALRIDQLETIRQRKKRIEENTRRISKLAACIAADLDVIASTILPHGDMNEFENNPHAYVTHIAAIFKARERFHGIYTGIESINERAANFKTINMLCPTFRVYVLHMMAKIWNEITGKKFRGTAFINFASDAIQAIDIDTDCFTDQEVNSMLRYFKHSHYENYSNK